MTGVVDHGTPHVVYVPGLRAAVIDHDSGDEDRNGSVQCYCNPWCGLPICDGCTEDHGGHLDDGYHLCRDCDLDYISTRMTCSACDKWRLNEMGISLFGEGSRCTCPEPRPPTKKWRPDVH